MSNNQRTFLHGFTLVLIFSFTLTMPLLAGTASDGDQDVLFGRQDSLRGALRPERTAYDVSFYHLDLKVDPQSKRIDGSNRIVFRVREDMERLQLDLFENMEIDRIVDANGVSQAFVREGNAVFVNLDKVYAKGSVGELRVYYGGAPTVAINPPWDGGFTWVTDAEGSPWIGVSCEGIGASLWWPNKDHPSEEPDSMLVSVRVPQDLVFVGNGNLRYKSEPVDGWIQYDWFVSYPINNYNVTLNIGNYVHFSDTFSGKVGALPLDYYVLPYNLEKAKVHFEQVKPMLACFEEYFDPYPFPRDGFALVETPYLGMEHQGAIAYGNKFKTGYFGMDISRIGMTFDYLIIHETGHEWWGNSITAFDHADMWIQEGFCTYSEALYVECMYDYETAVRYINAKKPEVANDKPIVGVFDVNQEGSGDMYDKGSLILNTLRHYSWLENGEDKLWLDAIYDLTVDFRHQVVSGQKVRDYLADKLRLNLDAFWAEYLEQSHPPTFETRFVKSGKSGYLEYRWNAASAGFAMPIWYRLGEGERRVLRPTTEWQRLELGKLSAEDFVPDEDSFYYLR